jgi:hypothetical protein
MIYFLLSGVWCSPSIADDTKVVFPDTALWSYSSKKSDKGDFFALGIQADQNDLDGQVMSIDCWYRKRFQLDIFFNQKALGRLIQSESSVIARFVRGDKFIDLTAAKLTFSEAIWEGWTAEWDNLVEAKELFRLMQSPSSVQLQLVGTDEKGKKFVAREYLLPERNRVEAFEHALVSCF